MNENSRTDPTRLPYYNPDWSIDKPRDPKPELEAEPQRTVAKIIPPRLARKIQAAYRCAGCWSDLILHYHISGEFAGEYTVQCSYCRGNVPGFVTRTYIEYRIRQNESDYLEAKAAMEELYPQLFKGATTPTETTKPQKHTREDNISALGF